MNEQMFKATKGEWTFLKICYMLIGFVFGLILGGIIFSR